MSLVVSGTCLGICVGLATPTFASIISHLTSADKRPIAMGYFAASIDLAMGVGPILFGYLAKHLMYQNMLYVLLTVNIVYMVFCKLSSIKASV